MDFSQDFLSLFWFKFIYYLCIHPVDSAIAFWTFKQPFFRKIPREKQYKEH